MIERVVCTSCGASVEKNWLERHLEFHEGINMLLEVMKTLAAAVVSQQVDLNGLARRN